MDSKQLLEVIKNKEKPSFSTETERCLWLAGTGSWEQAHDIVESLPEPGASWIHAMLHREEGDLGNAVYWYHRAAKPMPASSATITEELYQIVRALLD